MDIETARREHLKPAVSPSPLQSLLQDSTLPSTTHPGVLTLAFQIQHNLQYQHSWTGLRLHTHSPLTNAPFPRPLLSGLPPHRLYVHPDEQIELLKEAERKRKASKKEGGGNDVLKIEPEPEREWILPTRLSEKWTLGRLSEIFDGIGLVPPDAETARQEEDGQVNPWRTTKRIVLAAADSDSTVVYYIVHDGVVKPRQN
ncbi:hypothetical protein K469DRAFT_717499 [Zopfia rhizophila CBS 207.26]|uniref:tRNA-splicing endonuclease subunit Sen15 domain-containing protein n=1 Tax=Zopfia rhizophila CBS 207.26 TaxID=1314779 RepID=A0A6A6DIM7_9PEZI|nr:hypothetical protein K469DRAFT_717499 [Zopfia rhizophila CBS 207.26]